MVMPGETQREELSTSEETTVNTTQGISMEGVFPAKYAARDETTYLYSDLLETASAKPYSMPGKTGAQRVFLTLYDQTFSMIASLMNSLIEKMEYMIIRMSNIENRLSSLENKLSLISENEVFGESRATIEDENAVEVSREQAKEMILKLFEQKGELDYFEIISELDLDLKLVVEICADLEEEKRIEGIGR